MTEELHGVEAVARGVEQLSPEQDAAQPAGHHPDLAAELELRGPATGSKATASGAKTSR